VVPVGLSTLATAVSESSETMEEVYDLFLFKRVHYAHLVVEKLLIKLTSI
jgi:Holliday junction resolvasome RuvABC ATP-dependent DNA helicase subunit